MIHLLPNWRTKKHSAVLASGRRAVYFEPLEERRLLSATPAGGIDPVNATTGGDQNYSQIASDAAGNFVVVWVSSPQDGSGTGIYGQRYTAAGAKLGGEFQINTTTAGDQVFPAVAMNDGGAFVVAWVGPAASGIQHIFAQRYDTAGNAVGGEQIVDQSTFISEISNRPAIDIDAAGEFVVTWQRGSTNGDLGDSILARRFSANGSPAGGQFLVDSTHGTGVLAPDVAMTPSGGSVVSWQDENIVSNVPVSVIHTRRYDALGNGSSIQTVETSAPFTADFFSAVAVDAAGNYAVTWSRAESLSATDIYARLFNSTGVALGAPFRVNTTTANSQFAPSIDMQPNGEFVIAWQNGVVTERNSEIEGSFTGISAQRFNAAGIAQDEEWVVNSFTAGQQFYPKVAVDNSGNFAITWSSFGDDVGGYGVKLRRYHANNLPPTAPSAGGPYSYTEGQFMGFQATGATDPEGQPLTYSWDMNNDGVFGDALGVFPVLIPANQEALGISDGPLTIPIRVQASDGRGGVVTSPPTTLTVTNAPPIVSAGTSYVVVEGTPLFLTATGGDPGGATDPVTYAWDVNGDGVFSDAFGESPTLTWAQLVALGINSGPANFDVRVKGTDDDRASTISAAVPLQIFDVAPTLTLSSDVSLLRGAATPFTFTIADPAAADLAGGYTLHIIWGDGSPPEAVVVNAATTVVRHAFDQYGFAQMTSFATESNGTNSNPAGQFLAIDRLRKQPNADNPALTDFVWSGTSGADRIELSNGPFGTTYLHETMLNGIAVDNSTQQNITGRVILYGQGGDDALIASGLTTKVTMDGGAGNNTLMGGNAGDVLIGGTNGAEGLQGNNVIVAGNGTNTIYGNGVTGAEGMTGGNNLIIGGTGSDAIYGNFGSVPKKGAPTLLSTGGEGGQNLIVGNSGADQIHAFQQLNGAEGGKGSILISGSSTLGQAALGSVLSEWTSTRSLAVRIANLTGVGTGPRNNDLNYLLAGSTVRNDTSVDALFSDTTGKENWLFYESVIDAVSNKKDSDITTLLH